MLDQNHQRDFQKLSKILKAIADENRLYIIYLLKDGEKCACELQEDLDLSQSGLSYHMKKLTACGLVSSRDEGKWTYYNIDPEERENLINLIAELTKTNF